MRKDATAVAPADDADEAGLVSLGSVFYEPLWLFYRTDSAQRLLKAPALTSLSQLPGWRLNIGARGSGSPNLMRKLIEANRIDLATLTIERKAQTPATMDLLAGDSDALVFASAPEALMVQMLLQTPGVALYDFAQADAYSRRFPFLSPVTLPARRGRPRGDVPPRDVQLLAPTATLLARADTHPRCCSSSCRRRSRSTAAPAGSSARATFPKAAAPSSRSRRRRSASTRTARRCCSATLPFWFANLIERMWPVLVSIIAILIPLSRDLPPLYQFRIRRASSAGMRSCAMSRSDGQAADDELLARLARSSARRTRHRAAELCRRAVFAAQPHPDGRARASSLRRRSPPPPEDRPVGLGRSVFSVRPAPSGRRRPAGSSRASPPSPTPIPAGPARPRGSARARHASA
jgi:hypothetical protein